MAAVLFMVGKGLEEPDVVKRMLDVELTPCKPQFTLADEAPLLLYACGFDPATSGLTGFRRTNNAAIPYIADVTLELEKHLEAAALASAILDRIKFDTKVQQPSAEGEFGGLRSHQPLMRRACEPSVEERMKKKGVTMEEMESEKQGEEEAE